MNPTPQVGDVRSKTGGTTNFYTTKNLGRLSTKDLVNPPKPVVLSTPPPPVIPPRVDGTINNVLGSIRSQSESAKRLQEEQAAFQSFAGETSGFDIQNEQLNRFGVTPEKLQQLEDIQLQLSDRKTESNVTKSRIEGAAGQTMAQGQREVTQEDREAAVRDAGLASRAAVLQGNIETGRSLARDAVDIALQDRTFEANAKLRQIEDLKGVVDEETAQLLEAEQRTYEAELATLNQLKETIATAMVSGASQAEISQLNSSTLDDASKLALAQSITARGANELRGLDIAQAQAGIANTYSQISDRNARLKLAQDAVNLTEEQATANGIPVEEAKAEKALGVLSSVNELLNHPGFGGAVGPNPFARIEINNKLGPAGLFAGLFTGNKSEFKSEVDRLANTLTLENMALLKGPATDKDVEIVAASMSRLKNMDVSEKSYGEELQRLYDAANRIVQSTGMTPEQAIFYGAATQEQLDEVDQLYGTSETTPVSSVSF